MKLKNKKQKENSFFKKHKIKNRILEEKRKKKDVFLPREKEKFSEKEVEDNLKEIYSNDGDIPDLKTIKIKKKRSVWLSGLYFLLFFIILASIAYGVFNYIKSNRDASSVLKISIESPEKVSLGEEFIYKINYENFSNYDLKNVKLEVEYPDNFIISEIYSIHDFENNKTFYINDLGAGVKGSIKVKGKIINQPGVSNPLSTKISYEIKGLSSQFSQESFSSVMLDDSLFQLNDKYPSTVLVGEDCFLDINIEDFPVDVMDEFIISFSELDNVDLSIYTESEEKLIEKIEDNKFLVKASLLEEEDITFKFLFNDKINDQEIISWNLKYLDEDGREFIFFEKDFRIEIIKSDLHLNLSVNGLSEADPVNFGDKLDYSINYSNKGEKSVEDLVIMAVLDGDFLDWESLDDPNNGRVSQNSITWSLDEISDLKVLEAEEEGEINFSINVSDFTEIEIGQELEIESYAQFNIGNIEDFEDSGDRFLDNRSNIIVQKINSDLSFEERVLYFDDNNIPVGSGPLPPAVGEKTSFRYYWTLTNTLHELRDIEISLELPDYVTWEDDFNLGAGNIDFDPSSNEVVWKIGRWPLGIDKMELSFNVNIMPSEEDYNKIIVLSSGSKMEAFDVETGDLIIKNTEVKTTKLEDDSIAAFDSDGRVVE